MQARRGGRLQQRRLQKLALRSVSTVEDDGADVDEPEEQLLDAEEGEDPRRTRSVCEHRHSHGGTTLSSSKTHSSGDIIQRAMAPWRRGSQSRGGVAGAWWRGLIGAVVGVDGVAAPVNRRLSKGGGDSRSR
jgi:hypothetical protein